MNTDLSASIRETLRNLNDASARLMGELDAERRKAETLRAKVAKLEAAGRVMAERLLEIAVFAGDHFRGNAEEKIRASVNAWVKADDNLRHEEVTKERA